MAFLTFNDSREGYLATFICSNPMVDPFFIRQARMEILKKIDHVDEYLFNHRDHWFFLHSSLPTIDFYPKFNTYSCNATVMALVCLEFNSDTNAIMEHIGRAGLKIWYNNHLLADFSQGRNYFETDPFNLAITFKEGLNYLLLEVIQVNTHWDFSLKLTNHSNQPLKDYKVHIPYELDDIHFAHHSLFNSLQVDMQTRNIRNMDELNLILHSDLNSCVFPESMNASIQITTEDNRVCFERKLKHLPLSVFRFNFNRVELELAPGFYNINLVFFSLLHNEKKNVGFFVLDSDFDRVIQLYNKRLKSLKDIHITNQKKNQLFHDILPTVEYQITFLEEIWTDLVNGIKDYNMMKELSQEIDQILTDLEKGKNPYTDRRGYLRCAYYHPHTMAPIPFSLYIPPSYNPEKKYPLVIGLHGYGSNHYLHLLRLLGLSSGHEESEYYSLRESIEVPERDYIVLSINGFGSIGYDSYAEDDFFHSMELVRQNYSINENRIYITGISMGGTGALYFLSHYPNLFAAGAILCPAYDLERLIPQQNMSELSEEQRKLLYLYDYNNYLENLKDIPLYIFHGSNDSVLSVEHSRKLARDLQSLGYNKIYVEMTNVNHNIWETAFDHDFVLNLLLQHQKHPISELNHIYQTSDITHNSFGCFEILKPRHYRDSIRVEAHQQGDMIYIQTRNVHFLQINKNMINLTHQTNLYINGLPAEVPRKIIKDLIYEIDDMRIERITKYTPELIYPPRQGIYQAFKEWHTFVISNNIDKKMKRFLTNLTYIPGLEHINFPIRPAETIDLADDTLGNIILIGSPESNIHIDKLLKKLNIDFNSQRLSFFGQEIHGSPIQAFFHYYNPFNPRREIVCYLISNPDVIPPIFVTPSLWFNPLHYGDYYVFNKEELVCAGVFANDWPETENEPV